MGTKPRVVVERAARTAITALARADRDDRSGIACAAVKTRVAAAPRRFARW